MTETVETARELMSAVYILDNKGRILINFDYRGEADQSIADKFMAHIQSNEKILPNPVFRIDDWCFAYIERAANLATLFEEYLGSLSADVIVDNFALIYELLDEVMDYGYPQTLDMETLHEYIFRDKSPHFQPKTVPVNATGVVTWRKERIFYQMNEVFVDVIEKVNMLVAKNGAVINNEIVGEINLSAYLSGMPEVRFGLNDKIVFSSENQDDPADVSRRVFELEDVKFHPCVRTSQFEKDRSITFIPPDGKFSLMSYRLSAAIKPIIHIDSTIERYKRSRVEMLIRARAQYRPQSTAQNVVIRIPVPPDVDTPKAQCTAGRMRYSPNDNALVWTIKEFPGRKQYSLRAHFGLPSIDSEEEESKRPVVVEFEIPFFTVSGLRVQYLKVFEKTGYQAVTWVRYITKNGLYEFRT